MHGRSHWRTGQGADSAGPKQPARWRLHRRKPSKSENAAQKPGPFKSRGPQNAPYRRAELANPGPRGNNRSKPKGATDTMTHPRRKLRHPKPTQTIVLRCRRRGTEAKQNNNDKRRRQINGPNISQTVQTKNHKKKRDQIPRSTEILQDCLTRS